MKVRHCLRHWLHKVHHYTCIRRHCIQKATTCLYIHVTTGSVAEWLELLTLVHVPQRTEVAGLNPVLGWVATGGSWVSFHPGFITRFLTCWSTDPNSNLSPVDKPPSIRIQRFLLHFGPST